MTAPVRTLGSGRSGCVIFSSLIFRVAMFINLCEKTFWWTDHYYLEPDLERLGQGCENSIMHNLFSLQRELVFHWPRQRSYSFNWSADWQRIDSFWCSGYHTHKIMIKRNERVKINKTTLPVEYSNNEI